MMPKAARTAREITTVLRMNVRSVEMMIFIHTSTSSSATMFPWLSITGSMLDVR